MTEEQTPEEHARQILERLREGGLWQPQGLGLSYMRTGENSLELLNQHNNPTAAQARIRMNLLLKSIGWTVDESDVHLIDVDVLTPQEQYMQEMMQRQESAQSWKCACGTPLTAFPLEDGKWSTTGEREMAMPTSEVILAEEWYVSITCPVCDVIVPLEPYDYGLLAGDDAMTEYSFTVGNEHYTLTALTRPEIIEVMDVTNGYQKLEANDSFSTYPSIYCTGTFFNGHLLPPHVRGAVVRASVKTIREEEE